MKKTPLWYPFILASLYAVYGTALLPTMRLCCFAPFLALCFYRISFNTCLWLALVCGLFIDILSSQMHFGLFALSHVAAAAMSYKCKKHFFEDKAIAYCLFSALISSFFHLSLMMFSLSDPSAIKFSLHMLLTDVVISSLFDMLYALAWFTLPIMLYHFISSGQWKKYLTSQKHQEAE